MTTFAGKTAASADKVRGGYYTPPAVARFLAHWVHQAGPKILEPSCGDGRILRELSAITDHVNRPGMSGDSSSWKGWGHVRWFIEEVPAGAA
ncbi:DNA methylase [Mycobacterium tuberculosis]|nr:DNA methylase [Mycobacterium tuberculosis]CMM13979.1 DNA methylase [Mycobacterium tuberculosis]